MALDIMTSILEFKLVVHVNKCTSVWFVHCCVPHSVIIIDIGCALCVASIYTKATILRGCNIETQLHAAVPGIVLCFKLVP